MSGTIGDARDDRAMSGDITSWQSREQGSRDWRMVPVATGVWAGALTSHLIFARVIGSMGANIADSEMHDALTRQSVWAWPLLGAMGGVSVCLIVVSALAMGEVGRRLIVRSAMVVACAALCAGVVAWADDLARWRDAAAMHARDGPVQVTAELWVDTPVMASSTRDADCQTDVTLNLLTVEGVTSPTRAAARLFAADKQCTALVNGARHRLAGELKQAEFGGTPLWLVVEDGTASAVEITRGPGPVRALLNEMQSAFRSVTERLSDQGRVLVPGLTLGVLGQDQYRPAFIAADSDPHAPDRRAPMTRTSADPVNATYAQRLEDAFQAAGLVHLMAVSGGHFVLIAALARRLCALVVMPRPLVAVTIASTQLLLAEAMFPSDSVTRALVMGMIGAFALALGRARQTLSALSWTVILVIAFDPSMASSFGFALSAASVMGIVLGYGPISQVCARVMPTPVAAAVGITVSAQLATLPIQMLMEPALPVWSVPANALVAPVVGFSTLTGLGAFCLACWAPGPALGLAWLASCGTQLMERVAFWVSGHAHVVIPWAGGLTGALLMVGLEAVLLAAWHYVSRRLRDARRRKDGLGGETMSASTRARMTMWMVETRRFVRDLRWPAVPYDAQ